MLTPGYGVVTWALAPDRSVALLLAVLVLRCLATGRCGCRRRCRRPVRSARGGGCAARPRVRRRGRQHRLPVPRDRDRGVSRRRLPGAARRDGVRRGDDGPARLRRSRAHRGRRRRAGDGHGCRSPTTRRGPSRAWPRPTTTSRRRAQPRSAAMLEREPDVERRVRDRLDHRRRCGRSPRRRSCPSGSARGCLRG